MALELFIIKYNLVYMKVPVGEIGYSVVEIPATKFLKVIKIEQKTTSLFKLIHLVRTLFSSKFWKILIWVILIYSTSFLEERI